MKTTRPRFPTPSKAFKSDRLLIRPITVNDLVDFHELRQQPEVMIWTSSGKVDEDTDATLKWIHRFVDPNDTITFSFAIEELANPGKVIGTIGCHVAEPPELGYMFKKEFWGRGYSTEALKAWLPQYWALDRLEVDVVDGMPEQDLPGDGSAVREILTAMFEEKNVSSMKVLQKCGFRPTGKKEAEEDWRGPAVLVWFSLERPSE